MLILKIGGSVFAPKNTTIFDLGYLKDIKKILDRNNVGNTFLVHGAGNIGHGFVKKHGMTQETFPNYVPIRKEFYNKFDDIFSGYNRVFCEDLIECGEEYNSGNVISGGDVSKKDYSIVSGDTIFSSLLSCKGEKIAIMLTDVDGVFDDNSEVISEVSLDNLDSIDFWEKPGDVTNSMKGKLMSLKAFNPREVDGVWICNGNDLQNFENILKNGRGIGTFIKF